MENITSLVNWMSVFGSPRPTVLFDADQAAA
jgi:hypothetical protein